MGADTTNNEAYSTTMHVSPRSKPRIVLTVSRLIWLERCTRRLWLDVHGDPAARVDETPAAQLQAANGQRHEHMTIEATHGPAEQVIVQNWPERVQKTLDLMRQGVSGIRQASLDVEIMPGVRLCGQIDALVRVEARSSLGIWSYEPIEIKHHREAAPSDYLQLDLYRGMLGLLQGAAPAGELWLGATDESKPACCLRITNPVDTSESRWQQLVDLVAAAEPPPIWFIKHCSYCPWRDACAQTALANGDLTILPNLHPTTATELRGDDITSVHQVAAMHPRNLQQYRYVGKHGPRLHAAAIALSHGRPVPLSHNGGSKAALTWPVALTSRMSNRPIFLDLETHGYEPWGFGFATSAEDLRIVLVAPLGMQCSQQIINGIPVDFVSTALAGWQHVTAATRQAHGPVIHWSQHEPKCLERSANQDVRQELADRLFDAYAFMNKVVVLPIPRLPTEPAAGIKAISRYLGIDREEGQDDWSTTESTYLRWYHNVRLNKQLSAINMLAPVVAYLRADVLGLAQIWQWLSTQLPQ